MSKLQNFTNGMKSIGQLLSIIIFGAVTALNYFLVPVVSNGLTFLLVGWFVIAFVIAGFFGGLGNLFGALFAKSKIKIIYILLSLAITVINAYFFWQVIQVI